QHRVDVPRRLAAIGDRPDDEARPSSHISHRPDARPRGPEPAIDPYVAAGVEGDAELRFQRGGLRAQGAHGPEQEIDRAGALGPGHGHDASPAVLVLLHPHPGDLHLREPAVAADEPGGGEAVLAPTALLLAGRGPEYQRPLRPPVAGRADLRRGGKQLDLL